MAAGARGAGQSYRQSWGGRQGKVPNQGDRPNKLPTCLGAGAGPGQHEQHVSMQLLVKPALLVSLQLPHAIVSA